ncbi:MAG: hypothetical protein J6Y37_14030 [Paludibacteraceae bacterium]|nr:hypothetical protein [Paludibacteraceae bacterium]
MPSGLTYQIYDGSDVSFRSYAIKCLENTGFGYRATQGGETHLPRYAPPVVKANLASYQKQFDEAETELETFKLASSKDPELLRGKYEEYCSKANKEKEATLKSNDEVKQRYTDMLVKIDAWNAPLELATLKTSMKRYIEESMDHDCGGQYIALVEKRELPTIEEWIQTNIESLEWNLKYYRDQIEREKKYAEEANEFFKKVYEEIDKIDPPDEEFD